MGPTNPSCKPRPRALIAAATVALLSPGSAPVGALAQEPGDPLPLPRIVGPIVLDGIPDETAWEDIPPLELVTYQPVFRGPMRERTVIRVGYDARHIYVGAWLFARDPSTVRSDSFERDNFDAEGDFLNLVLDTFNDDETAVSFSITPTGMRLDSEVTNDAEGDWLNASWNGLWDGIARRDSSGWTAEMRIPFATLRFQESAGRVVMGMTVNRLINRLNERHIFPATSPDRPEALWKPSLYRDVVFEEISTSRPPVVSPYVLLGGTLERADADPGVPMRATRRVEVGLDVRHALASHVNLDATLNPAFAQVEADDERVNLTRFSLLFPEKRSFFQERSGTFAFDTGAGGRLFHSRRIGLGMSGEPVRIFGGARLVGRLGDWDLGALAMRQGRDGADPSTGFGALRLRRGVLNARSFVGGMATARVGSREASGLSFGIDGRVWIGGDDYLEWSAARSAPFAPADPSAFMSRVSLRASFERRRSSGLGFRSDVAWSGEKFDPLVGFVFRSGYVHFDNRLRYTRLVRSFGLLRSWTPSVSSTLFFDAEGGGLESASERAGLDVESRTGALGAVFVERRTERLRALTPLDGGLTVPTGTYRFVTAGVSFTTSPSRRVRGAITLEHGAFFDGRRTALVVSPTWNASAHLGLGVEYERDRVSFPERGEDLASHIVRFRIGTALDTRVTLNAFVQTNSLTHQVTGNVRLRVNFREGTDLYVIVNPRLNSDVGRTAPRLPRVDGGEVLVKLTRTFF